jgi:long-chain acyl-CoA synthetase
MHPGDHAMTQPDKLAVVMAGTGETITYRQLDEGSSRLANLFRARGIRPGDHIAILLDNHPKYLEVAWAAHRCGLYYTPINWHLGADEAGYIVEDCGAQALITTTRMTELLSQLEPRLKSVSTRLVLDGELAGFESYDSAVAGLPTEPSEPEVGGIAMFYSSGTTGRPKGIKPPLRGGPANAETMLEPLIRNFGFGADTVYLCPAPLYHAAPLGWSLGVHRLGGTVVVMERFDAAFALELIERHHITEAQFVPTHFVRMLKLPVEERTAADLSSLRGAVHAAAPCPVDVKQQMIQWWGPIIYEYYAGSEGNGFCAIGPEEWLAHPGSVGRSLLGPAHILDEEGHEQPAGEAGQIWFETAGRFEYHNDPAKTASVFNQQGWSTLGDIGYLDDEGFLYLTDRVSHMIISGGVNIYPQEVENVLVLHPLIADVAVIGVPDAEMGESVKAVVQLADPSLASDEIAAELIAYCRARIAAFKCPRTVDFVTELPRLPNGKLLKRRLRDQYANQ